MQPLVNDRWTAAFRVKELGRYGFKVQGWVDHFETWHRDLLKRIKAETDAPVDYLIGADLIDAAASRASKTDANGCAGAAELLRSEKQPKQLRTRHRPQTPRVALRYPDKRFATESDREAVIRCRSRARPIQRLVRVLSPLHLA
jgi:starch synthase (maltosyl-transferring)